MAQEVKVSSKGQIVIPKDVREKLGLKPGDKVKLRVIEGKRTLMQPAVKPSDKIFVKAGGKLIDKVLEEGDKVDERKIREMLESLGVKD